jgi:hypothetical protein
VQAPTPGGDEKERRRQGRDQAERATDDLLGADAQEQRHRQDDEMAHPETQAADAPEGKKLANEHHGPPPFSFFGADHAAKRAP